MPQTTFDKPREDRFRDVQRVDLGLKIEEERASGKAYRVLLLRARGEHFVRCGVDHAGCFAKLLSDLEGVGFNPEMESVRTVASLLVHFTKNSEERVGTNPSVKLGHGKFEECEISGDAARKLLAELCPDLKIVEGTDW